MVFCRDGQPERTPLSLILPQLYLGAETDVTQDCLSAQGISYVLSVSRCCPQPSFLPQSHYLRIPIDDSLRDELLPWIPQALQFIDEAMSLGCSVIVHCAAGISRSPALAVAYVMYSLGMDLDHAYRFVKERRPTISPNFNFLGQLQLFQGTLPIKGGHVSQSTQPPVASSDTCLQPASKTTANDRSSPSSYDVQDNVTDSKSNSAIKGHTEDTKAHVHSEKKNSQSEGVLTPTPKSEFTLSLSDKLKTLSVEPAEVQRPALGQQGAHAPVSRKPTHLEIPLSEKRKSLTLSLTPVCPSPRTDLEEVKAVSNKDVKSCSQKEVCSTPVGQNGALKSAGKTRRRDFSLNGAHRPNSREASSALQKRREKAEKRNCSAMKMAKEVRPKASSSLQKGKTDCKMMQKHEQTQCSGSTVHHQQGAVEAVEVIDADQSPVSPINLTVNRLLGWGERMLLGILLGPHIKVGQAALPYRC